MVSSFSSRVLPLTSVEEDDLSLLTSLLEENTSTLACNSSSREDLEPDVFDELFDADGDGESYTEEADDGEGKTEQAEGVAALFGDVGDLTDNEEVLPSQPPSRIPTAPAPSQEKTNQELQDELRKLQEQMKSLQEQLKAASIKQPSSPALPHKPPEGKSTTPSLKENKVRRIQESTRFSAELDVPALPRAKRVSRTPKTPADPKSSSPRTTSMPSQPLHTIPGNKPSGMTSNHSSETPRSSGERAPPAPQVSVEAFSGLRLRRPRVSSTEMNKKMTGRRLIRLSQIKEKMATEKLEEVDWVSFGVILKKVTPQSANSGKTFSIWRLNDLRDLTRYVSLFLFGEVHKELWKTEQGTVVGLLNANPMKPKDGSEEVCLSIDHPQKVLIMGEALDLGTCKAKKKNGEPCTQPVNLNDCEYCQYHIQAQYKKLSAKRADLQSTFSGGRVPKKFKGASLKERLCQDGFYYGGVSSASYAASIAAGIGRKKIQTTLTNLVVKGTGSIIQETQQKLGIPQKSLSCSEEFRELMRLPTVGARNLKQHLARATASGVSESPKPAIQSISASALLKQQKQQMLEMRKRRSEELQRQGLQSSSDVPSPAVPCSSQQPAAQSPRIGAEFPRLEGAATPQMPKLGRGISQGDDVLFFDESPPPRPKLSAAAEAKKLAALAKLRAKGQILTKTDPNNIVRKLKGPQDVLEVKERVEKNNASPEEDELEPAKKRRREQLAYLESEEFQKILKAKSKHTDILRETEAELQESYFEPLVKKEQMEEKMRNIREVKCRVVTCQTCAYTHFKPLESCVSEQHGLRWHDGVKRFFKCPCGSRTVSLDRLPNKHCSNCGLYKWERDGMLKEKTGPKIGGETLLPRGEEHAKFLNSLK
uniref:protein MCM10 homolog isoform X2 n=1 Tax=Jaculus jaculus TaxID=51337 RepID=UPI001E1B3E97|nr:protein MCM10 homolog isoform X2 [Jaculus jaculus]